MGGEEERILYNIDVKMKTSRVINQEGMGECGAAAEIKTFSFRDSDDRSKYEEGNCIKAKSQFGGSTTFNANWIYDIEKIDC